MNSFNRFLIVPMKNRKRVTECYTAVTRYTVLHTPAVAV